MFERISTKLPYFARDLALFHARTKGQPDIARNSSLADALACMFECIIQFCKEACHIFTKDKMSKFGRGFVLSAFWKPFDEKFFDVISHLEHCTEIYQLELSLADREELMGHYKLFDDFVSEVKRGNEYRQGQGRHEEVRRLREQVRCIRAWINAPSYMTTFEQNLASNASGKGSWFLENDQYKSWRQSWIEIDNNSGKASSRPPSIPGILCVHGSPGYGKTVLSTIAIQDLTSEESKPPELPSRNLAFFHFTKLNESFKQPFQAMRAVLSQLIHKNLDESRLVDAASILMDVTGSGQKTASNLEVASLLKLFFDWHPSTALVFDGVDECSDPDMFFDQLHRLCSLSRCKILLFSRPNLVLPIECQYLNLQHGANHHDIRSFVRPRMEALVSSGRLPSLNVDSATKKITDRSNSLFLWAKLMMDFLDCPALSQGERLNAITHLDMLEGLEPLFREILEMIKKKYKPQVNTAYMAFSWISVARRPLKLLELQAGLAIKLRRSTVPKSDYIPDFCRSIIRICGALVEVRNDSTVHFIHLSVRDFLTSSSPATPRHSNSVYIPLPAARIMMASLCLSYIIHNVPKRPLGGSSSAKVDLPTVESDLPFLRHAIDWPDHIAGVLQTTDSIPPSSSKSCLAFYHSIKSFLENKSAMAVWLESVWAFRTTPRICEASKWMQKYASTMNMAQITLVSEKLGSLAADFENLRREWNHVLSQCSGEIWGPSIHIFYESSLLVGTTEGGLVVAGCGASGGHRDQNIYYPDIQEKQLLTQISEDGTSIISVSLIPGQKYLEHKEAFLNRHAYDYGYLKNGCKCDGRLCLLDTCNIPANPQHDLYLSPAHLRNKAKMADSRCLSICSGWQAHIQCRPTVPSSSEPHHCRDMLICLPPEQIFHMLMMTFYIAHIGKERYIIPVAVSQDLHIVGLLHCVIKLTPNSYTLNYIHPSHIINANRFFLEGPLSTIGSEEAWEGIYLSQDVIASVIKFKTSQTLGFPRPSKTDPDSELWMRMAFSRDGKYLAIIRPRLSFHSYTYLMFAGEGHGSASYHSSCSITIFENLNTSTNKSDQPHYAEISHLNAIKTDVIGGVNKILAFHPSEPCLAIANQYHVLLWRFNHPASEPRCIFNGEMNEMAFSTDGSVLSGKRKCQHEDTGLTTNVPIFFKIDFELWQKEVVTSQLSCNAQGDVPPTSETNSGYKDRSISKSSVYGDHRPMELERNNESLSSQEPDDSETLDKLAPYIHSSNALHAEPSFADDSNILGQHSQLILPWENSVLDISKRETQPFLVTEDKQNGMVLMETMLSDGTVKAADLLRIPKSVIEEKSHATIVNTSKESPSIKIVLNKDVESM
ncbi:hypothetical protein F5Y02DRAFT_380803 [Annulohypoxylon stygium]|nr:hypothetical protein F5Y02DRAFT_380803 [Annulohypoxylon stygium]